MDCESIWQKGPSTVMTWNKCHIIVLFKSLVIVLLHILSTCPRFCSNDHLDIFSLIEITSSKLLGFSGTGLLSFRGFTLSSSSHFYLQLLRWISRDAVPYSLPLMQIILKDDLPYVANNSLWSLDYSRAFGWRTHSTSSTCSSLHLRRWLLDWINLSIGFIATSEMNSKSIGKKGPSAVRALV